MLLQEPTFLSFEFDKFELLSKTSLKGRASSSYYHYFEVQEMAAYKCIFVLNKNIKTPYFTSHTRCKVAKTVVEIFQELQLTKVLHNISEL